MRYIKFWCYINSILALVTAWNRSLWGIQLFIIKYWTRETSEKTEKCCSLQKCLIQWNIPLAQEVTINRRYFGVLAYRGQQNQKSCQGCQKRKRCVCLSEHCITSCLLCKAAQTYLQRQILLNLGIKLLKKSPIFTRISRFWRLRSKPKKL